MTRLTDEQEQFLIYLSKTDSIDCKNLSSSEMKILKHLYDEKLIDAKHHTYHIPNPDPNFSEIKTIVGDIYSASVSEKGKAYFVEHKIDSTRYNHPFTVSVIQTVISAIAILISILALLISACSLWLQLC